MDENLIPSDLLTIQQAARLIGNANRNTIRRWILKGKLQGYKLAGERFLVSKADLLNLIQPYKKHVSDLPPTKREMTARQKYTDQRLREEGLR